MDDLNLVSEMTKKDFVVEVGQMCEVLTDTSMKGVKGVKPFLRQIDQARDFVDSHQVEERLIRQIFNELFNKYNVLLKLSQDKLKEDTGP